MIELLRRFFQHRIDFFKTRIENLKTIDFKKVFNMEKKIKSNKKRNYFNQIVSEEKWQ